jgi:uncharacterized membrane protein
MNKLIVTALAALVAATASVANARDDEPSWEAVTEYASSYMQQMKKQNMEYPSKKTFERPFQNEPKR